MLGGELGGLVAGAQRRTAHELVRDTLRRAIFSGALPGGTRLVQADIASQLQVSTTPVREALRDLAADGLIRIDPHRGAVVHELDVDEIREIYEIRCALEPLAIRKAAQRITEEELAAATALQDQMDTETDPGAWVELNWRFHSLLERAARSPRLQTLVTTAQGTTAQYVGYSMKVRPARMTEGNAEHRELLRALADRDPDRAETLLVEHLRRTLDVVLQAAEPAGTRAPADTPAPAGAGRRGSRDR
nr:GntR family transcriptional regulator [Micromonospora sp. DSM 115978]